MKIAVLLSKRWIGLLNAKTTNNITICLQRKKYVKFIFHTWKRQKNYMHMCARVEICSIIRFRWQYSVTYNRNSHIFASECRVVNTELSVSISYISWLTWSAKKEVNTIRRSPIYLEFGVLCEYYFRYFAFPVQVVLCKSEVLCYILCVYFVRIFSTWIYKNILQWWKKREGNMQFTKQIKYLFMNKLSDWIFSFSSSTNARINSHTNTRTNAHNATSRLGFQSDRHRTQFRYKEIDLIGETWNRKQMRRRYFLALLKCYPTSV